MHFDLLGPREGKMLFAGNSQIEQGLDLVPPSLFPTIICVIFLLCFRQAKAIHTLPNGMSRFSVSLGQSKKVKVMAATTQRISKGSKA